MDLNKQVIFLKNKGDSLRQIAKEVGISHVAVKKRLDKLTAIKPEDKADQEGDAVIIEANLYGFEHKHPVGKINVNNAILMLNSVLEELDLNEPDKKIVIDAGHGWRFEKALDS
jgi:hypothetical protein